LKAAEQILIDDQDRTRQKHAEEKRLLEEQRLLLVFYHTHTRTHMRERLHTTPYITHACMHVHTYTGVMCLTNVNM